MYTFCDIYNDDFQEDPISFNDLSPSELFHYGTPRHSGRYPWGSGKNPQRNRNIYSSVKDLKSKGYTEKQIADTWGMSTTELRKIISLGKAELYAQNQITAKELKEKGYSNTAIGKRMGVPESTVRNWLNEDKKIKQSIAFEKADVLKEFVDLNDYTDIGPGIESYLGCSRTQLKNAVKILEDQGYQVQYYNIDQMGTNHKTTVTVLAKPGSPYRTGDDKYDYSSIACRVLDENGNVARLGIERPVSVDPSRVHVRYAEDGGADRDGAIYIRPGQADINFGGARYAQVRIGVGDTHYIKGVAMMDPTLPPGVDILVNSNKKRGTPLISDDPNAKTVLKPMKRNEKTGDIDWDNPFGASVKDGIKVQKTYIDPKTGEQKLSPINVVYEEGDWSKWTKHLPAQFASKQTVPLAKRQLALAKLDTEAEFENIMSLTNPTVKRKLLWDFAEDCDAKAVDLNAAPLPRQAWHVLMPFPDIKEGEVYAPNYRDGETVALVRFPHEGTYQIPICKVKNKGSVADKFIHNAPDAIGVNAKTAAQLSGADFDGDTVIAIPISDKVRIRNKPPIQELVNYDPKESYPAYPGMKAIKHSDQQMKMGVVSNLITDMTLAGAPDNELVRATKYAMCIIDSEKHKLNHQQCFIDQNIAGLQKKYQPHNDGSGRFGGAGTLISKAGSPVDIPIRSDYYKPDPVTGKKIYSPVSPEKATYDYIPTKVKVGENSDGTPIMKTKNLTLYTDKDGRKYTRDPNDKKKRWYRSDDDISKAKTTYRTQKSTKMAEAEDAYTLTSGGSKEHPGYPMEAVYADYANSMKSLGNRARVAWVNTGKLTYNPEAAKKYKSEVASLKSKNDEASRNAPLERQAQALANKTMAKKLEENPNLDREHVMKYRGQAINASRKAVGAHKQKVSITPKEWEAIQAGAISDNLLMNILNNADADIIRQYAMPNNRRELTTVQKNKIKIMNNTGYTLTDIADSLGVSPSTVSRVINGEIA